MLKQRVITALILAPLVVAAVLLLPNGYLALIAALVITVGSMEWARLSGIETTSLQIGYSFSLLICLLALYFLVPPGWVPGIMLLSVAWWLLALLRLVRYRADQPQSDSVPLRAVEGFIVLLPAWLALVSIHRIPTTGPGLLLFVLILIWSADIGAYFAGHRWGKHKLAPQVSPGKTREGVYGAMACALLCAIGLGIWLGSDVTQTLLIVMLCLATVLASVIGDLFESLIKRQRGVKDSGQLLPGHGGMLDRIDSLTAAAPLFLFGLILLGEAQ
ncbi:MAG: phosphatidate cytidylyltransferase [gamma proteobacterium symbiont of Ctena orbiculata]|nr:MAG: phosphatidate cytidylyltransferase [gamma proteobacterium symbiont of Ctena orbiculata]PVV22219.1 MAG: phosphatidate cytidylyltransferase [gamma proteobacterium symbiont of Ctena orbiculata]PVV24003.1 MAG: phosphatidate cytidylyltransferase [gamma proteobacterium symbiont of Ctena orbiculata]